MSGARRNFATRRKHFDLPGKETIDSGRVFLQEEKLISFELESLEDAFSPDVTEPMLKSVISRWTGIPIRG